MLGKILVADDSFTVRMHLQDVLTGAGFAVTTCECRAALMDRLGRESFSLLVLDPALRDGSGLELLKKLRTGSSKISTPILVLSGHNEIRRRVLALELGANEFIDKPYHPDYLLERVFDLTTGPRSVDRPTAAVRPSRLLVVDDSVTYGNALADELRRDGHDVILARTASEALSLLALQSTACVVLDVFMPEVSGVQLCRRLRGDVGMRSTSILVLTGRKDSALRDTVLEAGADDFATKTHDLSFVRERVRDLINRPRRARSVSQTLSRKEILAAAPPPTARITGPLLDRVISASGMSELLGRSSLRRACERAGVDPVAMSPGDLGRALPYIAQTLGLFIPPHEVEARMTRIAALSERETAA